MPTSDQIRQCPRCQQEARTPFLAQACSSVGIEYGLSTGQMLLAYLTGFHERGHEGGHHDRLVAARLTAVQAQQRRRRTCP